MFGRVRLVPASFARSPVARVGRPGPDGSDDLSGPGLRLVCPARMLHDRQ